MRSREYLVASADGNGGSRSRGHVPSIRPTAITMTITTPAILRVSSPRIGRASLGPSGSGVFYIGEACTLIAMPLSSSICKLATH